MRPMWHLVLHLCAYFCKAMLVLMCVSALGGRIKSIKRRPPVRDMDTCICTLCPDRLILSDQASRYLKSFKSRAQRQWVD